MNKQIEIRVNPDGSVVIEGKGFKGAECEKATKAFEEALGTCAKRTKKPEYTQTASNTQRA